MRLFSSPWVKGLLHDVSVVPMITLESQGFSPCIPRPYGRGLELCAEHVRQFGSESLLPDLMEVKG
jgi:hypothetical protein